MIVTSTDAAKTWPMLFNDMHSCQRSLSGRNRIPDGPWADDSLIRSGAIP